MPPPDFAKQHLTRPKRNLIELGVTATARRNTELHPYKAKPNFTPTSQHNTELHPYKAKPNFTRTSQHPILLSRSTAASDRT